MNIVWRRVDVRSRSFCSQLAAIMHGSRAIGYLPTTATNKLRSAFVPACRNARPSSRTCWLSSRQLTSNMAAAASPQDFYPHGLECISPDTSMAKVLTRLGPRFEEVELQNSKYVKPAAILYDIDGATRTWEIIKAHASVGVVLYHTERDAFLLVRQFRPPLYASRCREAASAGQPQPPRTAGFTIELCAGLVDKAKPLEHIVAEEIAEECGYLVAPDQVTPIGSAISAAGTSGSEHVMYFATVSEAQRDSRGGGLEHTGEAIEVLSLPWANVRPFLADSSVAKSPGLMYGLLWAQTGLASGELPGRAAGSSGQGGGNGSSMLTESLNLRPVLPS